MDLSIVIVNYNTKDLLNNTVRSVISVIGKIKFEIIIVDNCSSDGSIERIKKLEKEHGFVKAVYNKKNLGFGQGNNIGMKMASGEFILLLNSDTESKQKGMYQEIISWLRVNPEIGIFSCALVNKDGSIQANGGYFPSLIGVFSWMIIQDLPLIDLIIKPFHPKTARSVILNRGFYNSPKELDWVTGAFFMMRNKVVRQVGYFDNDYFMYTEDVDYCYRAKQKGWKAYYSPGWKITHFGGASSTKEYSILNEFKGIEIFYRKNYAAWKFPILRFLLKMGSLWRMLIFGVLNGKDSFNTYAKAFRIT